MATTAKNHYGKLLRHYRKRAGLSEGVLAHFLRVPDYLIRELEAGRCEPSCDPEFYQPLREVSEFTDSNITSLLEAAEKAKPQDFHTQSLQINVTISLPDPDTKPNPAPNIVKPEAKLLRIHYTHTMPDHGSQIVDEGKWQQSPGKGVVFQNRDAKLLFDALGNPDHKNWQRAQQAVQRFATAVAKDNLRDLINEKGILIQEASQKYGVPASTLGSWGEMGLLPILHKAKGKQGVYLDEEAVARAAPVYHEAKQQGAQPVRRLKAILAQQAEGNVQPSP